MTAATRTLPMPGAYNILFEANPQPMYAVDRAGLVVLDANAAFRLRFGLGEEAVQGLETAVLWPEDEADHHRQALADTDGALASQGIWPHRDADGEIVHLEVSTHEVEYGGQDALLVLCWDVTEQLRSAAARRVDEARYRMVFEGSPHAIILTEPDGTIVDANGAACALVGVDRTTALERNAATFYADPAQRAAFRRKLEADGSVHDMEVRMWGAGGEERSCLVNAAMLPTREGPPHFLSFLKDVTEQRQVEEALRQRSWALGERVKEMRCLAEVGRALQMAASVEEALAGVATLLPGGMQFPEITVARVTVGEAVAVSAPFPEGCRCLVERFDVPGGPSGRVEVAYAEARPEADLGPFLREEEALLRGVAERLVEALRREAMARSLERSEALFRTVTESGSDMVAIVEGDGTIRYLSPSAEAILGEAPSALLGSNAFERVHVDDVGALRDTFQTGLADPTLRPTATYRFRHADGRWLWLESAGRNLLDDRAVSGVLVSTRDITDRVELEAQLRQSQKLDAVGRLAGGIAHDFNNVLTVVLSNSQLLLMSMSPDDPHYEEIQEMERAARRATGMTRQLLAFSKNQSVVRRRLDLNPVVTDMERMLSRMAGEDVAVTARVPREPLHVTADEAQLQQVLLNLGVNAREAMPGGGAFTMETYTEDRCPRCDAAPAGGEGWACIRAADTGAGIPPEVVAVMFEPFFTTKERGTGLGLSTVYGIVEQSGGHIHVQSTVGVGTTFEIRLPRTPPPAGEAVEVPASIGGADG